MKNKRYIPYGRQSVDSKDIKEVVRVLKSDWITQGPRIAEFELKLASFAKAKFAVAVSSGTAALHLACLAAGIKEGDEVITSPITFAASANCALYCGARIIFADIKTDMPNIDPRQIKIKITGKTRAVIPVHFGGYPCDMEEIYRIAKKHNIAVIEDACHALGAEYKAGNKWLKIGSCRHSDMAVLSFYPIKSITTGEGGAILTNRRDLYEKLLILRNHGITRNPERFLNFNPASDGPWYYEMQELGFNYRITDFQCALGISQLKKIGGFIKERRKIAGIYKRELSQINEFIIPDKEACVRSSWHIYYIRLKDAGKRNYVFEKLRKSGIGVQVHYIPVYLHPYYRKTLGYKKGDFPIAEDYYKRTITIPIYHHMAKDDIEYVINALKKI